MTKTDNRLEEAYNECMTLARSHYENFPVASLLLPKHIRAATSVIYAFARRADDFADEGDLSEKERLQRLDEYDCELDKIASGKPASGGLFLALDDVIKKHNLSINNFKNLLSAFKQDVLTHRYTSIEDVLEYCSRSANPVGRIVLELNKQATPDNIADSDKICTALQLINFYQDIEQDYRENNRIYLPIETLQDKNLTPCVFHNTLHSGEISNSLRELHRGTYYLMSQAAPLGTRLPGRLGFEIRMTVWGGLTILKKLYNSNNIICRPRLNLLDWLSIILKSLFRLPPSSI